MERFYFADFPDSMLNFFLSYLNFFNSFKISVGKGEGNNEKKKKHIVL